MTKEWKDTKMSHLEAFKSFKQYLAFLYALLLAIFTYYGMIETGLLTIITLILAFFLWFGIPLPSEIVNDIKVVRRDIEGVKKVLSEGRSNPLEREEEVKTSGGGAIAGMIIGATSGLFSGPIGVLVGGIIGAIIGNQIEYESLRLKKRRSNS